MGKLSVETEYDKAVNAVATSLTDCYMRKKYGECTDARCKTCDTYRQQVNCLNNMPDIDKIRVDNNLARQLAERMPDQHTYATGLDAFKIKLNYDIRYLFNEIFPVIFIPIAAILICVFIV